MFSLRASLFVWLGDLWLPGVTCGQPAAHARLASQTQALLPETLLGATCSRCTGTVTVHRWRAHAVPRTEAIAGSAVLASARGDSRVVSVARTLPSRSVLDRSSPSTIVLDTRPTRIDQGRIRASPRRVACRMRAAARATRIASSSRRSISYAPTLDLPCGRAKGDRSASKRRTRRQALP